MQILIIANNKIVFGRELRNELLLRGFHVSLLDFQTLELIDDKNNKNYKYYNMFKWLNRIPKLRMFFRMILIGKILSENNYDIINIHFSRWYYLLIIKVLLKRKYIITIYGSDFYRTSKIIKKIKKALYKYAKAITFTNPLTMKSFVKFYDDFEEKSYVCRFGLKTLEYIDKIRNINKRELKNKAGFNKDKIIVTCGYNSTIEQQHEKIIENILKLPLEIRKKIQFIFPMTYGDDVNKEKIKNILREANLDYIVLEEFLYGEENALIKLASDIMINLLKTDSFSGSMQEYLYANNIVITGSWLPYNVLDEAGIQHVKIDNIDELSQVLANIIDKGIESFDVSKNPKIISHFSLWENTINSWINVFKNVSLSE